MSTLQEWQRGFPHSPLLIYLLLCFTSGQRMLKEWIRCLWARCDRLALVNGNSSHYSSCLLRHQTCCVGRGQGDGVGMGRGTLLWFRKLGQGHTKFMDNLAWLRWRQRHNSQRHRSCHVSWMSSRKQAGSTSMSPDHPSGDIVAARGCTATKIKA